MGKLNQNDRDIIQRMTRHLRELEGRVQRLENSKTVTLPVRSSNPSADERQVGEIFIRTSDNVIVYSPDGTTYLVP